MAKQKKKKRRAKKENAKIIVMTGEETDEEEDLDDEDEESGIHLDKDDIQLIYKALKHYKPTQKEQVLYETLLEQFEEMLVVDYGVKLPGSEFMDEEED